jgi:hypothetical protein
MIIIGEKMRSLISALGGIIIAFLIFIALIASKAGLEMRTAPLPDLEDLSPISVRLTVSGFTEPHGIGSTALLTINITSSIDASKTFVQVRQSKAFEIWSSQGISLVVTNPTWSVDLLANTPVIVQALINATEVGYGRVTVETIWHDAAADRDLYSMDTLGVVVLETEISVFHDIGGALPLAFPPGYDPSSVPEPANISDITIPWPPS